MKPVRRAYQVNLLANRAQRMGQRTPVATARKYPANTPQRKDTSIAERPRAGVPDFRSLDLVLRIFGLAALACLIIALARVPLAEFPRETAALIGVSAPVLFVAVGLLAMASPWTTRWPISWVIGLSFAIVGALTVLIAMLDPRADALQALALAWLCTALVWIYLNLRTQAKSPAFDVARLQALQARIRPHFLFNSLNAVASMVRSEPRKAETALMDLADLYRALMKDNKELTYLSEEVLLASQYLTLEKMRLNERLRVKWFTDNMPHDALVPPLLLQPILENAVYHGIEPAPQGGDIVVNIFSRRDQLSIVVTNPYLGEKNPRKSKGNNMAVGNIRERLKLHFDTEGTLAQTTRGNVYEVRVTMPYRKAVHSPNTLQSVNLP
jgi:two-component system, LytTR family, sensor histidine kinase AlgZ